MSGRGPRAPIRTGMSEEFIEARDLSAHARYVSDLTELVGKIVEDFGVFYSPAEAIPTIVRWTVNQARETGCGIDEFIRSAVSDLPACAEQVAQMVLLGLAEERPGSDPWDHDATIRMPMPAVGMTLHALTLCGTLALANDSISWSNHALHVIGRLSAATAEQFLRGEPRAGSMFLRVKGGEIAVRGPILRFPQPGLAELARFFDGVAARVERGVWTMGEVSASDREDLALNLRHEATMLRDLTGRFGMPAGPRQGS